MRRLSLLFFTCLTGLFFLTAPPTATGAMGTQPSDIDYYIHENPSFSLIFSKNFLNKKKDFLYIHKKISYYDDIYRAVFPKDLKETPIYVFASPRNQNSNAITFGTPFLKALFFPTGVEKMTWMASPFWEDTVIAHEMAHIFQLGQMSSNLKYLRPIFKNSEVVFLPFPIFLNVNLVMPLFLLEGHAVLSESLFAPGGRLYSGAVRALVFSQIKHKFQTTSQFTKNYLINLTEDTFIEQQPYNHGAYFFNSLLDKYDIKKINRIFKRHAEHFIAPFSFIAIKDSFESVFNNSFESLVHYYIQKYQPLAVQQQKSSEETLFFSGACSPFNKKENEIFFLTFDLKTAPALRTLNMVSGKWRSRKKTFSPGKMFKIKDRYYVSGDHEISSTERVYGLFSEGMHLNEKYHSQKVQDIQKGKTLSIDTSNNMRGFHLQLNGQFYDITSSSALFGPDGGIYYFKQEEENRVLYKNKTPLFHFKGFYGKPVEITEDGTVYFTAPSPFGSSLFAWHGVKGIYRVSASDVIIDAIKVEDDWFLVCEVGPSAYSYKIIPLTQIREQPAFYNYSFRKISSGLSTLSVLSNIKDEMEKEFIQEEASDDSAYIKSLDLHSAHGHGDLQHDISYSPYLSLTQLRFNGLELGLSDDPITGYNGIVNISFRDPMEYNAIHFSYQMSLENGLFQGSSKKKATGGSKKKATGSAQQALGNWIVKTKYINNVYRLAWDIQHIYKEGFENFSGSRAYSYIHEVSQGLHFPLFQDGFWYSSLDLKSAVSRVKFKTRPGESYYFSVEPGWQIQYRRMYIRNFDFHRHFFLRASLQYHFKFSKNDSNYRLKTNSYYLANWGWEFYTMPFISYQMALKPKSIPFRRFKPLNAVSRPELNLYLRERIFEETNDYLTAGIKLKKYIETPMYFARFPVSLMGLAPSITGKFIQFLDNGADGGKTQQRLEWTLGIKMAFLFHHKVKFRLNLYYGFSHPYFIDWDGLLNVQNSQARPLGLNTHFGFNMESDF